MRLAVTLTTTVGNVLYQIHLYRVHKKMCDSNFSLISLLVGGGLSGYVKSKPLGNGQIISIDALVFVMINRCFRSQNCSSESEIQQMALQF